MLSTVRRPLGLSVRAVLLLLAMVSTLPMAGALAYMAVELRHVARERAVQEFRIVSDRIEDRMRAALESAIELLTVIGSDEAIRSTSDACDQRMHALVGSLDRFSAIVVVDEAGNVLCSPQPLPGDAGLADRDYFRRALETTRPVVTQPVQGRLQGVAVIPVALRLDLPPGTKDVLALSLKLDVMLADAIGGLLPEGGYADVWNLAGTIHTQAPAAAASEPAFPAHLNLALSRGRYQAGEKAVEDGAYSGIRLTRTVDLGEVALIASVSIPEHVIYQRTTMILVRSLMGVLVLTGVCLLLAHGLCRHLIVRPLEAISERLGCVTAKLGAGIEPSTVLGSLKAVEGKLRELNGKPLPLEPKAGSAGVLVRPRLDRGGGLLGPGRGRRQA